MKRGLLILLFTLIWYSFPFLRPLFGGEIPVFALEGFRGSPEFYVFRESSELCRYSKVIIWGVSAFKQASEIRCPSQQRIVSGILYVKHFYRRDAAYLALLPSVNIIKSFGQRFVVLTSGVFDFYLHYLEERGVRLERIGVSSWHELESALRRAENSGLPLLLLPEPPLLDQRAQLILKNTLQNSSLTVINLLGRPFGLRNERVYTLNLERVLRKLKNLYFSTYQPGEIFYLD